jgi:hypothetical protein
MHTERSYEIYQLIYEPLQKMYRVTDGYDYSFWFNENDKDELMKLNNFKFKKKCEEMLLNSSFVL